MTALTVMMRRKRRTSRRCRRSRVLGWRRGRCQSSCGGNSRPQTSTRLQRQLLPCQCRCCSQGPTKSRWFKRKRSLLRFRAAAAASAITVEVVTRRARTWKTCCCSSTATRAGSSRGRLAQLCTTSTCAQRSSRKTSQNTSSRLHPSKQRRRRCPPAPPRLLHLPRQCHRRPHLLPRRGLRCTLRAGHFRCCRPCRRGPESCAVLSPPRPGLVRRRSLSC
mmetsp:Transcript_32886/g.65523  ORF Transcript_32886/g.65523 Transcript_32886/m.65523 type:complete len:220 (-) Transcript_32886:23-682(-)